MNQLLAIPKHWVKPIFFGILLFVLILLLVGGGSKIYQFWDKDPDRGATIVKQDVFGDSFATVKYLDQGWKPADSLWFYTTTQGSDLLPYDFFMALEQADKKELFSSSENMNRYRYLPQKATFSNPDALPVGFVKDSYRGKNYIGYTCAACHTGQVNYKGTGIRIDGAPATADLDGFMKSMAIALKSTTDKPDVRKRFVDQVLKRDGDYDSADEVEADLKKYSQLIDEYNKTNESKTNNNIKLDYGYARLDAFGRIYNRVLEHLLNTTKLRELLQEIQLPKEKLKAVDDIFSHESNHLLVHISQLLSAEESERLRSKIFNRPNAPVSYPFLWDIPQHDYVQWNGTASNAGLGPVGRNTGEVIGVFGTLDWLDTKDLPHKLSWAKKLGLRFSALLGGQGLDGNILFESSINVRNLRRIESKLWNLQSPQWPDDIFPPINPGRKNRGEVLFDKYCGSCHAEIDRSAPDRRIVAHMSSVKNVKTDAKMAENSVNYEGWSGILRNQYVGVDVGSVLLDKRASAAGLLTQADKNVVATPDPDVWFLRRWGEWAYDLISAFFDNEIKPSIKQGDYDPDSTASPFASLLAYKGRSLNGIWATAPYLHNGSVPTLYDLLLPKKNPGDPEGGEYRPDEFQVGSREFDPEHVGLKSSGYKGFTFQTSLEGNSNAGHEYASGHTPQPDGTKLPAMTREQRLDLLEYLKSL